MPQGNFLSTHLNQQFHTKQNSHKKLAEQKKRNHEK